MWKKLIALFTVLILIVSCGTENKIVVNRKIKSTDGDPMLIGRITRSALTDPDFNSWFSENYDSYKPDAEVIKKMKGTKFLLRIEIYMGTWCSDSQQQIPDFFKILDQINFPEEKVTMYALNRNKESFYGEQLQKGIEKVPTIIIYKGDLELGRIIETPKETLELDLYQIIKNEKFSAK